MIEHQVEQNSDSWKKIRLGRITASGMDQIITPTGKQSTSVDKYVNKLLAEQISGESADTFEGNFNTARGHEYQEEAARYFSMLHEVELKEVGFVTTDDGRMGCSPDYLIGDDAFLEVKTGLPHIMIEAYLAPKLEQVHRPQCQATAFITQRKHGFVMLYNPNIKPIIVSADWNDPFITSMKLYVDEALKLMDEKKAVLRQHGFFAEDATDGIKAGEAAARLLTGI